MELVVTDWFDMRWLWVFINLFNLESWLQRVFGLVLGRVSSHRQISLLRLVARSFEVTPPRRWLSSRLVAAKAKLVVVAAVMVVIVVVTAAGLLRRQVVAVVKVPVSVAVVKRLRRDSTSILSCLRNGGLIERHHSFLLLLFIFWLLGKLFLLLFCLLLHFERCLVDLEAFLVARAESRIRLRVDHCLFPPFVKRILAKLVKRRPFPANL